MVTARTVDVVRAPAALGRSPLSCTGTDLLLRQLAAIEHWHREVARPAPRLHGREQLMDGRFRAQARAREREGLLARLHDGPLEGAQGRTGRPTVLVAHRREWFAQRLCDALGQHGLTVLGVVADGAEALGAVVAEQPDVVLAEERLPFADGLELARRAARLSPHTLVAVQVGADGSPVDALARGAGLAVTRQVPPADVAAELAACFAPFVERRRGPSTPPPQRRPGSRWQDRR